MQKLDSIPESRWIPDCESSDRHTIRCHSHNRPGTLTINDRPISSSTNQMDGLVQDNPLIVHPQTHHHRIPNNGMIDPCLNRRIITRHIYSPGIRMDNRKGAWRQNAQKKDRREQEGHDPILMDTQASHRQIQAGPSALDVYPLKQHVPKTTPLSVPPPNLSRFLPLWLSLELCG